MIKKYNIIFAKKAQKELLKLPLQIQKKIADTLLVLSANHLNSVLQIKKLSGRENLFRIRIGDYRLVYEIQKNVLIIFVVKVGHRKEVYRDL